MIDFSNPDLHDSLTITKSFHDLPLPPYYITALSALSYTQPTPVQYYSILKALSSPPPNIIVQSKSGTGKTLAFTTISLSKIFSTTLPTTKQPVVLILEPTRELAVQVYQSIRKILASGKAVYQLASDERSKEVRTMMMRMSVHLSIGGLPIEDDKKKYLETGCHIVVGTVGRVYELVEKGILSLKGINTLVLDEGDKLFEQADSVKKLKSIINRTNKPQILVYSATYSNDVVAEIRKIGEFQFVRTVASDEGMEVKELDDIDEMKDGVEEVDLGLKNITKLAVRKLETNQRSLFTQKLDLTKLMLSNLTFLKCLIFVEKKAQIPQVFQALKSFDPLLIHGSLSQATRIKLMNQINTHKVIITSDLLARGIDIVVDLIILFNSGGGDNFWHRVGRTGRIGRKGVVISLDEIEGWEEYQEQVANEALRGCEVVEKKQVFGEYMADLGNWFDVDEEMEIQNLNGYRYFDEEEFERDMRMHIEVEVEEIVEESEELVPDLECLPLSMPAMNNQQELRVYLQQMLKCECCISNLKAIQSLTGYQFQILKMI